MAVFRTPTGLARGYSMGYCPNRRSLHSQAEHSMGSDSNGIKWNSIGAFGYLGFHALSIALIARLEGAESVGIFLLAQAVGMPLSRLSGLRYHDINATEHQITHLRRHVGNVSLLAIPLSVIAGMLWVYFTDGDTRVIGPPIMLANVLLAYAQIPQGRLIRLRKFKTAALFEIARGVTSVLSFSTGIILLDSFFFGTVLLVFSWTIIVFIELHKAHRLSLPLLKEDTVKINMLERMRYSLSDSMAIFQTSSVRLAVGVMLGDAAVGIFGATALLIKFIQPAAIAVAKTLLPQLADGLAKNDFYVVRQQFSMINRTTAGLIIVFTGLGYWVTPPFIELLLGESLRPPPIVAAIIMFGAAPLVGSRFQTQILIALRDRFAVERVAWATLISSVALAPVLIWMFGLAGAAVAVAVGYFVRYALCAHYVRNGIRNNSTPAQVT